MGGIQGAAIGAAFGAVVGYINPISGLAYIGGFSSLGGQALGNVLNGQSAFSHISYGAVAGAAIGGKFAPAIEGVLGQNMSSAFGNGLVSGITEANGELIGKGLGER